MWQRAAETQASGEDVHFSNNSTVDTEHTFGNGIDVKNQAVCEYRRHDSSAKDVRGLGMGATPENDPETMYVAPEWFLDSRPS